MPDLIPESAFAEMFINDTPLLDVRAPLEFDQGAFPSASNLPLLSDEERAAVGTLYKEKGKQSAIELGNQLVCGSIKDQRLESWKSYVAANPKAYLYCYRGGLRSDTVQSWLEQSKISIARVEGGYKAMRRYLITQIDDYSVSAKFLIIAGKTGSGKTILINQVSPSIDLEGIANHRGSAFGRRVDPQPTQINFENQLAIELVKICHTQKIPNRIFLEDESRAIGALSIPQSLHSSMLDSPIAVIEENLQSRVSTILNDYIVSNYYDFKNRESQNYENLFQDFLLSALDRIQRRLGDENYRKIKSLMIDALRSGEQEESLQTHSQWIEVMLRDYYDPMYEYQLGKKLQRVVFRGSKEEFFSWSSHINSAE